MKIFLMSALFLGVSLQTVYAGCTKGTAQEVQMKGDDIGMPSRAALDCMDKIISGDLAIKDNPNFIGWIIMNHCCGTKVDDFPSRNEGDEYETEKEKIASKKKRGLIPSQEYMSTKYSVKNSNFGGLTNEQKEAKAEMSSGNKTTLRKKCEAFDRVLHDFGLSLKAKKPSRDSDILIGDKIEG